MTTDFKALADKAQANVHGEGVTTDSTLVQAVILAAKGPYEAKIRDLEDELDRSQTNSSQISRFAEQSLDDQGASLQVAHSRIRELREMNDGIRKHRADLETEVTTQKAQAAIYREALEKIGNLDSAWEIPLGPAIALRALNTEKQITK